ncbi:hypothetical protein JXB02_05320 [Candidatus Woesearchaeota archaeon]|nr:hypothetical protein [Candidatus Woesearchaeota archaeon]
MKTKADIGLIAVVRATHPLPVIPYDCQVYDFFLFMKGQEAVLLPSATSWTQYMEDNRNVFCVHKDNIFYQHYVPYGGTDNVTAVFKKHISVPVPGDRRNHMLISVNDVLYVAGSDIGLYDATNHRKAAIRPVGTSIAALHGTLYHAYNKGIYHTPTKERIADMDGDVLDMRASGGLLHILVKPDRTGSGNHDPRTLYCVMDKDGTVDEEESLPAEMRYLVKGNHTTYAWGTVRNAGSVLTRLYSTDRILPDHECDREILSIESLDGTLYDGDARGNLHETMADRRIANLAESYTILEGTNWDGRDIVLDGVVQLLKVTPRLYERIGRLLR